jgi:hypothetical protein
VGSLGEPLPEFRRSLWRTYRASIPRFLIPESGLMARSIEWDGQEWRKTEPSPLGSAEMLKALFTMDASGVSHAIDAAAVMDRLMAEHVPAADLQVVSLTLWAAAIGRDRHVPALLAAVDAKLSSVSQTLPLAWTLSALSHGVVVSSDRSRVRRLAQGCFTRLSANQDLGSGLFRGSARREGWLRRRRTDTTLSSQTYPIHALVSYAAAFGDDRALFAAERCAERLLELQGPQGQWWWRYDTRAGSVLDRYPVYCVNQDSAIPAAFGRLQAATGKMALAEAVDRGLSWQNGHNEASLSLIDERNGRVARSIAVDDGRCHISWEMYAYQPAHHLVAALSNPEWAAAVLEADAS